MVIDADADDAVAASSERARLLLLAGLMFVVVVLIALTALPPVLDALDEEARVRSVAVQQFLDSLAEADVRMQEMRASVRGYVITGEPTFRDSYEMNQQMLAPILVNLAVTAPQIDVSLPALVSQVTQTAEQWQRDRGDRQVELTQQGRADDAAAELSADGSQQNFSAFRSSVLAARTSATALRSELEAQLLRARSLRGGITSSLAVLGLLAVGFVIAGYWQSIHLTRRLRAERRRSIDLAHQVREQYDATSVRNRQLSILHAAATAALSSLQAAQRAHSALSVSVGELGLAAGAIWVQTDHDPTPSLIAAVQRDQRGALDGDPLRLPAQLPAYETAQCAIIRLASDNEPVRAPNVINTAAIARALTAAPQAIAILPLRGRNAPVGVLMLVSDREDQLLDQELAFLETLAAQIGLLIENAVLHDAAQTERRRLHTVFDHSPEGIVVAEAPDGRIALANHAALELLGPLTPGVLLTPHPLAGRVFLPGGEPCPADDLPLVKTLFTGVERRNIELVLEQVDGQRVPILVTSVPIEDNGVIRGAVAVFQDLRQLREVERLKSDFVALVSHELRTPLAAIKGSVETMLHGIAGNQPSRIQDFARIIDQQSDRLQELIDNLLSLSQIEAGALRLRRGLVALGPLIQGVVRQQQARFPQVHLKSEIPARLPLVSADPRRIEQILVNLIDNAVRFSPDGGVITVGAEGGAGDVRLMVRDQGPGIPVNDRERVFERFYQATQVGVRATGGTGLGLAICKALVEAHNGTIWADDAPGGGALLQFTLPALSVDALPETAVTAPITRLEVGTTRILVVDDDTALQRVLQRGLEDNGYRVTTASSAEPALEAMTQQQIDLILLDIMLPGIDGFEVCRRLREWASVPIVMLTARATEQDIVRAFSLGADDFIAKPFRMSELIARIEAVLRRAQPEPATSEIPLRQDGWLSIDLARRQVRVDGREVALTPTEYGILALLVRHQGQVLTHEQILRAVWGEGYGEESHYLWVHIAHLRQKIEPDPRQPKYVLTERGVGYRMVKL